MLVFFLLKVRHFFLNTFLKVSSCSVDLQSPQQLLLYFTAVIKIKKRERRRNSHARLSCERAESISEWKPYRTVQNDTVRENMSRTSWQEPGGLEAQASLGCKKEFSGGKKKNKKTLKPRLTFHRKNKMWVEMAVIHSKTQQNQETENKWNVKY